MCQSVVVGNNVTGAIISHTVEPNPRYLANNAGDQPEITPPGSTLVFVYCVDGLF